MKKLLQKYWWFSVILLSLLCLPIAINILCSFNAPYKTWEYPSNWATFWSTYLAAIASLGMIIITACSIISNKKESESNRSLQLAALNYQFIRQHIDDASDKFLNYLKTLDFGYIASLPSLTWPPSKRETILSGLAKIINDTNLSIYKLELSLSLLKSGRSIEFKSYVLSFQESVLALYEDLRWFLTLSIPQGVRNQFDSYDHIAISDFYNNSAVKFKDSVPNLTNNITRIWSIIENIDFSSIEEYDLEKQIIDRLVSSLKFRDLKQAGMDFFKYEINNIESNMNQNVKQTK